MDDQPSLCPFKKLLNKLSSHIDQMHLESLKHVCGNLITAVERDKIAYAFDVFTILEQKKAIGKEPKKMAFLLEILKALRPKKKELVHMVKRYIEENYDEPERQEILGENELESSSEGYQLNSSYPSTPQHATVCNMHYALCDCNCHPCVAGEYCGCCCVIVAISLIFLALLAVVFWYTRAIPIINDFLHSNENWKNAGGLVIGVLVFIAACCVGCGIYVRVQRRNNLEHSLPLRSFNSNARCYQAFK